MIVSTFRWHWIASAKTHHFGCNVTGKVFDSNRQIANHCRPDPLQRNATGAKHVDSHPLLRLHELNGHLPCRPIRMRMADQECRCESGWQCIEPGDDKIDVIERPPTPEFRTALPGRDRVRASCNLISRGSGPRFQAWLAATQTSIRCVDPRNGLSVRVEMRGPWSSRSSTT